MIDNPICSAAAVNCNVRVGDSVTEIFKYCSLYQEDYVFAFLNR